MKLNKLPRIKGKGKKAKRVGRGYGSGKGGHTVGRGQKGQKVRGAIKLAFEGGQLPLIKRIPRRRGFYRENNRPVVINIQSLNIFENGAQIDEAALLKEGLLGEPSKGGVKILGSGEITKKIKLKEGIKYSRVAKEKIEKVGGRVE